MELDGTRVWLLIAALTLVTLVVKGIGPVLLGGRDLPPRASAVVALMPGPLLAALVVTAALSEGQRLHVDASTAGVAVAGVLIWRRAPLLVSVLVAVAVTAGLRAVG